jgi:hypothetical protein
MPYHVDLPTGYATSCKQARSKGIEEIAGDRQKFLALMIGSEGRDLVREKVVVLLSSSFATCRREKRERRPL